MSFDTIETSVDDGQPLELVQFTYLTNNWYFTTSESPVVYEGNTFSPLPFKHSDIAPSAEVSKSQITIGVPKDCPVGELFRAQSPAGLVTVTIFAKHAQDAQVKAIWKGRVINAEWQEPWLNLTSESVFSSLQRVGLRRNYAVQCPHTVYSQGEGLCNVNKESFRSDYVVTTISGLTVFCEDADGVAVDRFAGGEVTWTHATDGYLVRAMIKSNDGAGNFTLLFPPQGLALGAAIHAYPGCDHDLDSPNGCPKFGNQINYGGQPFIPKKNPFNGSTLY